ncbi:hypothetical protein [Vibrio sp. YIC-376]|uniref:hypothetical protein n=1 Tax=Vibrio sp. YIC-376 TaxID=3136162 RepID=UPI00402ADAB6
MDITKFTTIIIDCDGILVNHYKGILRKIYDLDQDLPQDIPSQKTIIKQYLDYYYGLSESLVSNGFLASHGFAYQFIMKELNRQYNWRKTFQFGRAMTRWPLYEDAYGALHYLKKFFKVFIRLDIEPEDLPHILKSLELNKEELIIRGQETSALSKILEEKGESIDDCLLLTTTSLAEVTQFPNVRILHRSPLYAPDTTKTESLASLVIEHQNTIRSSWH